MYEKIQHPLQLSPSYIKTEDRIKPEPKKVRHNYEPKRRFIKQLGKGDMDRGYEEYQRVYNKAKREAFDIILTLKDRRQLKPYSLFLGLDSSFLSALLKRKESKKSDFRTFNTMNRIIDNYDKFLEETK